MLDKLKDKYVFFDIDGTLSEYRYKDQLYASRCPELGCQSLSDLLFSNLFINARPLKTMQKIISQLDSNNIYILSTVVCNNEIRQKYVWLEKNYPNIKKENIIFIGSTMLKPEVMLEYAKHYNIKLEDIVFVDDRIDVLRKSKEMGIVSYHPSSFVK